MKDNTNNRERGNTLSLIVTCALFIVVIGLGFDFLLMIFKGHRRLTNSTDAIALDMAKNFIRAPKVKLNPGFEMDNWGPLSDNGWVDLYRFNKIVSQTILSAANALADGSPLAIDAANELIAHLQAPAGAGGVTSKSSVAERLRVELEKAAKDFSDGQTFDINISSAEPASLFPAAIAGPGKANASSTGITQSRGYAYGHPGAPGDQGKEGSAKDKGGSGSRGSKGSNGGKKGRGNAGWNDGRSWSDEFGASVPVPGTTKYQSFAGGTPSAEKKTYLDSTDYISWVDKAGPSNIAINPMAMPFLAGSNTARVQLANAQINVEGKAYVPGYTELTFANGDNSKLSIMAAIPMRVTDQPHLISTRVFEDNKARNFIRTAVPPNAFKFVGSTVDSQGRENISAAAAQAASGNWTINAAFDFGYIEVVNRGDRGGYDYDGKGSGGMTTTNVFSKELMSGIYLADNGAFSTKQSALQAWADYNNGKGPKPQEKDSEGNQIVHGNTNKIGGLDATRGGAFPCKWMHVTHGHPIDNYDPKCGDKLEDFKRGYPDGEVVAGDPTSYMAVEQFKQTIRSVFNKCDSFGCPTESTGLRVYTDGYPNRAPDVEGSNPATKKGRFWRDIENPVPEKANSQISRAGTIRELAEQVNPAESGAMLDQLKSRMLQIVPTTKPEELDQVLDSLTLELGEVAYIYKKDSKLVLTNDPPPVFERLFGSNIPGINDKRRNPAGTGIAAVVSGWYQTIGNLVNPPREGDIHLQLYTSYPDPGQVGQAEDRMHWTPGVGTTGDGDKGGANNLGRLTFENKCGGKPLPGGVGGVLSSSSGDFCQPD